MKNLFIDSLLASLAVMITHTLSGADFAVPQAQELPQAQTKIIHKTRAQWLWGDTAKPLGESFLRYSFNLKEKPKSAWCYASYDDSGLIFINGVKPRTTELDCIDLAIHLDRYEFAELLTAGKNTISFKIANNNGPGGLILRGEVIYEDGTKELLLSEPENWKASFDVKRGWQFANYDDSAWKQPQGYGDASARPWHYISRIYDVMALPEELSVTEKSYQKYLRLPDMSKEDFSRAKIDWRGDMAAVNINGKLYPPFFYLILGSIWQDSSADQVLKSYRSGIRLFWDWVILEKYHVGNGKFDFSPLNRDIERLLSLCPDAQIALNLRFSTISQEWMKNHPDELVKYATGPAVLGSNQMKRYVGPSYASEPFRKEFDRICREFTRWAMQQSWSKRFFALRVSYGCYGEWHYYGTDGESPDTSLAMQKYFRKYLADKYKTDAALAEAWHMPQATLAAAEVPDLQLRKGQGRFLRDPATTDRISMDYFECHQQALSDLLLIGAKAVKEINPDLLVGAYYGYNFCLSYPPEGQIAMLDRVLASPYIDFLSSPHGYTKTTRPVTGDGLLRSIPLLFRKYGKLMLDEMDDRTHLATNDYYRAANENESIFMLARGFANVWLAGGGAQIVDMDVHLGRKTPWYNSPAIYQLFHNTINIWQDFFRTANYRSSTNDIAVVWSTMELVRHGHLDRRRNHALADAISDETIQAIRRSGFAVDLLTLEQYLESGSKYKTVVFMNAISPTEEQRKKIKAMTRRPGVTAIYSYIAGAVTEKNLSAENASDLIGITLKMNTQQNDFVVKYTDGTVRKKLYLEQSDAPTFYVEDAAAQTAAHYLQTGKAAEAVKKFPNGAAAIFAGSPICNPARWREIFRGAGHHSYTPGGVVMQTSGNLMMVLADKARPIPVRLPEKVRQVRDLFSGKVVARNTDKFMLRSQAAQVWLLKIEQ